MFKKKERKIEQMSSKEKEENISVLNKLPSEIWIRILYFLTPIDLCFSVPTVCKLFYQLGQENQIWKNFRGNKWDEYMKTEATTKYITPSGIKNYKNEYVRWIKQNVDGSKIKIAERIWYPLEGKRNFDLIVVGSSKVLPPNKDEESSNSLKSILLDGTRFVKPTTYDSLTNVSSLFNSTKNVSLSERMVFERSRSSPSHLVRGAALKYKGVFYCCSTFNETEKGLIMIAKKSMATSPDSHLMILDYSPKSGKKVTPDMEFMNWIKNEGVEFVKFEELNLALEKMVSTLEMKLNDYLPKYLPTINELKRFAVKEIKV